MANCICRGFYQPANCPVHGRADTAPNAADTRAMLARVRAVGAGGTINGAYREQPEAALARFRADLLNLCDMVQAR